MDSPEEQTAKQPMAAQPTADQQTAKQPVAGQQTADQQTAKQPVAGQQTADQQTAKQPVAGQQTADQQTAKQPVADQQTADQQTAKQPVADQPTAEQPAAEQPAAEQPDDWELWEPFLAAYPRHKQLARHRERARARGPHGWERRAASLSRDEIVRAAIAVADADGADAVSMRRIARELNAGTMSLYWHISSKEELLDLMLDFVEGEPELPEPSGDWRAHLQTIARSTRGAVQRHPWVMDFMGGRPPSGPKAFRNLERSLTAIEGLDLDKATAMNVLMTVGTYVMGAVLRERQEMRRERDRDRDFAELSDADKEAILSKFVEGLRASGRYPHLSQMIEDGFDPDAPETRDQRFEFGLELVLDGIGALLARRAPGAPRTAPTPPRPAT
jgi:AcrR family transcriptional regulator